MWEPWNDVNLRVAIVACSLEVFRCRAKLIEIIRWYFEPKHDDVLLRGLLALADELGVIACPVAPVIQAANESGVAVL